MDYRRELEKLKTFKAILDQYDQIKYESNDDARHLNSELVEAYGSVEEVIEKIVGRSAISVPIHGQVDPLVYPNFIEAGYLSGRTIHAYQGRSQLLKVIGKINSIVADPTYKEGTERRGYLVISHPCDGPLS